MNVNASRTSVPTTTNGSNQRFQTINIASATSAVTTIFTTVSDSIDPTNVKELSVGVRLLTNHLEIDWSV
jgi:hypothetical protein